MPARRPAPCNPRYHVCDDTNAVVDRRDGVPIYDLIDEPDEARMICEILNRGIGPAWDDVEPELMRMRAARKAANP